MSSLPPWLSGDADVLGVLLDRRARGGAPDRHDDGRRVVLVVEGGGMRGACIGGMVRGLVACGLREVFDEVIAVSAGAFTATGFVLGDVRDSVAIYADDLARGGFVSWQRYLTGRGPLISLDYLIDEVMTRRLGVRWDDLPAAAPALRPVATDLATLSATAFDDLRTGAEWRTALRASSTVPLFAGDPVEFRGRRYVDGFAADALPLARTIASGATHVVALVTRAPGERLGGGGGRWRAVAAHRYERVAPGLAALMAERPSAYSDSLAIVTDPDHRHRGDARVLAIRTTHATGVRALTTDPVKLWRAGAAGEDAVKYAVAWAQRAHAGRPARAT